MRKVISIIKVMMVLTVMACIFYLSSQSGTNSRALSNQVMEALKRYIQDAAWLTPSIKETYLRHPVVYTRKLAHLTIYFILGFVSYLVMPRRWSVRKKIVWVISLCLIYAVTDELHQFFVPDRSAQGIDVLIDTLGSSAGMSIGCIVRRFK